MYYIITPGKNRFANRMPGQG